MFSLSWTELSLRLVLAAVFGAAIGIERERKDWAAGMRTHMLVCVGSCLMMMVSSFGFGDTMGRENVELDPSRVAAQIISGIGFIGAGTILFLKPTTVLGLTTASGLWTVAGIGMATGGGMYYAAIATTILAIIILWGMQPIQKKFSPKFQNKSLVISIKPDTSPQLIIERFFEDEHLDFANFSINRTAEETIIEMKIEKAGNATLKQMAQKLHEDPSIKKISWSN
jgi:putative Mg2+ transporter-C (MgtC) family protein